MRADLWTCCLRHEAKPIPQSHSSGRKEINASSSSRLRWLLYLPLHLYTPDKVTKSHWSGSLASKHATRWNPFLAEDHFRYRACEPHVEDQWSRARRPRAPNRDATTAAIEPTKKRSISETPSAANKSTIRGRPRRYSSVSLYSEPSICNVSSYVSPHPHPIPNPCNKVRCTISDLMLSEKSHRGEESRTR